MQPGVTEVIVPTVGEGAPLPDISMEFKFFQGEFLDSLNQFPLLIERHDLGLIVESFRWNRTSSVLPHSNAKIT
jgi:hypothetical protein